MHDEHVVTQVELILENKGLRSSFKSAAKNIL